jgi:hypothetical protein
MTPAVAREGFEARIKWIARAHPDLNQLKNSAPCGALFERALLERATNWVEVPKTNVLYLYMGALCPLCSSYGG